MDFRLHLSSRIVLSFQYKGDDVDGLIKKMNPKELFNRPAHQFLGDIKTVTVNPEEVEWIEVQTSTVPKNTTLRGTPVFRQLTAEAFNKRVAEEKVNFAAAMEEGRQQGAMTAFGMATFRSGNTLSLEAQVAASPGDDRASASIKIFKAPAVIVLREGGGILLVNPKTIAIWQVVPGLKASAYFTLPAELKALDRD